MRRPADPAVARVPAPAGPAVPGRRWAVLLAWSALGAGLVARQRGWTADDVYITYRYARNFARGLGLVFNPGQRVFGDTEPGAALLLGAGHALTHVPVDLLGAVFTAVALLAVAGLLLDELARRGRAVEGVVAGTLLLLSGVLWDTQGAAGPGVLALLLLAAGASRPVLRGVAAGAAVWMRPDAAVGVGWLALERWLRREGRWRFLVATAAVVALGLVLVRLYYGALLPESWAAKRLHAERLPAAWLGFGPFWGYGLRWIASYWGPAGAAVLALGLVGQPLLVGLGPRSRVLSLTGLGLFVVYPWLRVPFFLWYAIPTLVAALYGAVFLLGSLARRGALPRRSARLVGAAGALVALLLATSVAWGTFVWLRDGRDSNWRLPVYGAAGEWLRAHSAPADAVAFHEIGILGYTSDRPLLDLLGLVSPTSMPFARQGDVVGAFLARPPEYFLDISYPGRGAITAILARDWFGRSYERVAELRCGPDPAGSVVIYRRRPGAVLPAAPAPRTRAPLGAPPG